LQYHSSVRVLTVLAGKVCQQWLIVLTARCNTMPPAELCVKIALHMNLTAATATAQSTHFAALLLLLLLLSCRHYLQRWARHACSKQQLRQQLAAALQLHKLDLVGSAALRMLHQLLKQRLTLWQQHKQLRSMRAWMAIADALCVGSSGSPCNRCELGW
jgi:hypothetical protein